MIYILYYLICAVSSFYLTKNYVESNLRRVGIQDASIATAMRNAAKKDETIDPMHDCPDHVASALFWTIILVYNLLCWPFCLMTLVYWQINKQDFSDYRG
jgi:hypothetical protein